MFRTILTAMMTALAIITSNAQTANNEQASISWALPDGTITEAPVYTPTNANQFIAKAEIVKGTGLNNPVAKTSDVEGITQTMFPVTAKTSSASDDNTVSFLVTLQEGISFTPTKVGFKAFRWKTDKGNFDAAWLCDDAKTTLASGIRPNRGAGSGASTVSAYSYDLSGSQTSERQFGLSISIYNFEVAADKGLSLGDVIIEGTLYGTVGQPLNYTLTVTVTPEGAGTVQVASSSDSYPSGQLITLTQQPSEGYIFTGWQTSTGKVLSNASTYSFNIKGNTEILATYVTLQSLQVNDYIVVSNIDEFRTAIAAVNEGNSTQRRFIFLKNGDYDYGTFVNSEAEVNKNYGRDTIKVDNVSLIGQSIEGVNVHIQPTMASVSRTSPIVIAATGTYLQDFTLQNNYANGGNDGQAAALMDKGHHTIGKNMSLVSRQCTYNSDTDHGQLYFEDTHFEGTVDYICGSGDVFFNRCDLVSMNRQPTLGDYKGDTHIAAPNTIGEDFNSAGGHGYIFMDCHVDCKSKTWDFGRGWRGWPKIAFLNTTLSADACKRLGNDQTSGKATNDYAVVRDIDYTLRVSTKGIQSSSDSHYLQFYEYNTMDDQDNVVSPESNVLEFTASDKLSYETILKADEIDCFQLRNVFPDWTPDDDCRQVTITSCQLTGNLINWETDSNAKAFLIEKNGDFIAIVDGTQKGYVIDDVTTEGYTVRAANMMGGFGVAAPIGTLTTGIAGMNINLNDNRHPYNLAGQRVNKNYKGVVIVNGIKYLQR